MALNPPGGSTTFDAVRDEALKALGMSGASPLEADVLNSLMLLGLEQLYTQIWDWPTYQHVWEVTIDADDYAPDTVEGTPDTVAQIFDPMYRIIHKVWRTRDHKELLPASSYPEPADSSTDSPTLLYWWTWGDDFQITPPSTQQETYEFIGYREINRSLFTVSGQTVTWQTVDLPDECIEIFQHLLQGFILNAVGDLVGARQWLQIAASSLEALKTRNEGRVLERPAPDGFLYMNGTSSVAADLPTSDVVFLIGGI